VTIPAPVWLAILILVCAALAALWRTSRGRLRRIETLDALHSEERARLQDAFEVEIANRKNAEIALRETQAEVQKLQETVTEAAEQRVRPEITGLLPGSEKHFRLMVEGLQDYAMFMLDTDGRVVSWNLGAERIYGYSAEEILGKHVSIFYPEEDLRHGDPDEELRLAAIEGRVEKERWRVRRDAARLWASVVITAVHDDSGDLCGFSKVIRDITERRRAQQQLEEQRARAEQAHQAKIGLLAAMSREIRTPMNAILGMTDLLGETELNQDQRHYVEIFRSAGANLLDLIDNIVDLSQIESGRLELERAAFNLETVVAGVTQSFASKARDKGIALRSYLTPDVPSLLIGDAARLRQILVNLMGNVIKFTNSGEVAISAGNREGGRPGEIGFTVSGAGTSIPPDRLDAIFDPFAQVDSSTRSGGTGLGLAISRRLVESMGGNLRVESESGRGRGFQFTARFDGAAPVPAAPTAAREILVADDSPDNRFVIQAYLKHHPYALVFVADGKAALKQCSEKEFDAVLMDVQMPVMDGLAAARAIREMEREQGRRPVPILALTANAGREAVEASRLAGCTAHLSKPVSKAAVVLAVEDLLAAKQPPQHLEQPSAQPKEEIPITVPEGLESLAPRYLSARRKEVREMVALLSASAFAEISSRGHNLKGTGRSYGFPDLTDIGAALERFAKSEDKEGIDKQLLRLANYLESVRLPAAETDCAAHENLTPAITSSGSA